jgi:adenylate cyclase
VPITSINNWQKAGWLLLWSAFGTLAGLKVRSPWKFLLVIGTGLLVLGGFNFFIFVRSLWLPFIPAGLSWLIAAVGMMACLAYQEMVQRAALMHLFSRHVSKDVASAIWEQREQFLDGQRPRPQQLIATALFTDLVGFTSISEKLAPEQLMDWLNEYMEAMATQVGVHGGVIEQYSGDAIVAIFGVPIARKSEAEIIRDAINAVACALSMEATLRNLNDAWRAGDRPTLAMRIGIFTGAMVAGSLGSSDRLEYVVIGDTVNVASRLESFDKDSFVPSDSGSPCRILVGEATASRLGNLFSVEKVGGVALKGKQEKIMAYRILGYAGASSSSDDLARENSQVETTRKDG